MMNYFEGVNVLLRKNRKEIREHLSEKEEAKGKIIKAESR
jgi:hypothetical protein